MKQFWIVLAVILCGVFIAENVFSQGRQNPNEVKAKRIFATDSARFTGPVIINGALTVSGAITGGSSASDSIAGKLIVRDSARIGNTLTVQGAATVNANIVSSIRVNGNTYPFRATKPSNGANVFTVDTTGNGVFAGTLGAGGLLTFNGAGEKWALHTITAGDSVFGHAILRSTDTVLVFWNGTSWKTIADVGE